MHLNKNPREERVLVCLLMLILFVHVLKHAFLQCKNNWDSFNLSRVFL